MLCEVTKSGNTSKISKVTSPVSRLRANATSSMSTKKLCMQNMLYVFLRKVVNGNSWTVCSHAHPEPCCNHGKSASR